MKYFEQPSEPCRAGAVVQLLVTNGKCGTGCHWLGSWGGWMNVKIKRELKSARVGPQRFSASAQAQPASSLRLVVAAKPCECKHWQR